MAAKLGQKKKGQTPKKVQPVNDVENDSNVVLTKTPVEVNTKREKAKNAEKKGGFVAFLRKFDPIALSCFIAIILAGVVVLGAYVNSTYINPEWDSPVAVDGDTVEVRYVGSYGGYYWQDGAVIFDTNVEYVNNSSEYIKSPSYTNKTKFDLLEFDVGGDKVLAGFGDAVIGKLINWEANAKIAPEDGYGVSEKTAWNNVQTYKISGTMSLEDFNAYASTNLKSSDLDNEKEVEMPNGLTAVVNRAGVSDVTYRYVGLVAGTDVHTTKLDSNVKFTVTTVDVTNGEFTLTYDAGSTRMYKVPVQVEGGYGEKIVYVDDFDKKDTFMMKAGAADNADMEEQKGEILYFWIEIVDINDYADQ